MAIITTKEPDVEESIAEFACKIIEEVGGNPPDRTDIELLLSVIRLMLRSAIDECVQQESLRSVAEVRASLAQHKLEIVTRILEDLIDVSYDEALDHATLDMMEVLATSGLAEITDDGDLRFDASVVATKGDLKPALREAIARWVQLKVQ